MENDTSQEKINATILFVDDEKNILSSLKRLFRPVVENIFIAESGAEGLEILNKESVDIIVSDMRMPEMDGAEFLGKISEKWPDTIRVLLTGYADITSTINAINKGSIYRYISKPWEDNDIIISVRQALEQKFIREERDRLLALTNKQNEELMDLNANLEAKVTARTEEVQQTMAQLEITHESLKNNYESTIKVFSSIIELREGGKNEDNERVTELAIKLAKITGMSESDIPQLYFASLLRNIGRIGFDDELIRKPYESLSNEEKATVKQHPVIGHGVLMGLDYLQDAAKIIRSQYERYDGEGFPDTLKGEEIPMGAKIIRLVSDYYGYQTGLISIKHLSEVETRERIKHKRGMTYDPKLVDILYEVLDLENNAKTEEATIIHEKSIKSSSLKIGMELTRDLTLKSGVVLLNKGQVLSEKLIRAIKKMEVTMKEQMDIHISTKNEDI